MFPKIGVYIPPKWMVKIMVPNPMNKWMIWGVKNPIFGSTHLSILTQTPHHHGTRWVDPNKKHPNGRGFSGSQKHRVCPQTLAFPTLIRILSYIYICVYMYIYIYINIFSICLYYVICYKNMMKYGIGHLHPKKMSVCSRDIYKRFLQNSIMFNACGYKYAITCYHIVCNIVYAW